MTRQLSRRQAALLGAVVLLGLALACWVVLTVQQRRGLGGDAFTVQANFADVAGTEVGTRVRLQGIDAGEVVAVLPPDRPGSPVTLQMLISGKIRHLVTTDARVQIASDNLFAGRYVRILPGSPGAAPIENGTVLASTSSAELLDAASQTAAKANAFFDSVERGKGPVGMLLHDEKVAQDLAQTVAKVKALTDSLDQGKGTLGLLMRDDKVAQDLAQSAANLKMALAQFNCVLDDLNKGKGTMGMLLKDAKLGEDLTQSTAKLNGAVGRLDSMVVSVRQNSDAIKSMPLVRSYVIDAHKELVRPECKRFSKWFPENVLFEPGKAVLTDAGCKVLDEAAPWVNEHKEPGSEVVIASFAAPTQNADVAQTLTQKQAEAVCAYLKNNHHVHSTGWWWWSSRSVRAVGVGTYHPALPEADKLPVSRVEIVVFAQGSEVVQSDSSLATRIEKP